VSSSIVAAFVSPMCPSSIVDALGHGQGNLLNRCDEPLRTYIYWNMMQSKSSCSDSARSRRCQGGLCGGRTWIDLCLCTSRVGLHG
jgi:hypothetical protein